MTATLYAFDDTGAPTPRILNIGDAYTVLKTVLFVGYGSRPAHGVWQLVFDDPANFTMVIKHPTDDIYYRIDDNVNTRYLNIQGGTGATDVNTITGSWTDTNKFGHKTQGTTNDSDGNWYIIADDVGDFLYLVTGSSAATTNHGGFGFCKPARSAESQRKHVLFAVPNTTVGSISHMTGLSAWVNQDGAGVPSTGTTSAGGQGRLWELFDTPDIVLGTYVLDNYKLTGTDYYGEAPQMLRLYRRDSTNFVQHERIVLDGRKFVTLFGRNTTTQNIVFFFEYDVEQNAVGRAVSGTIEQANVARIVDANSLKVTFKGEKIQRLGVLDPLEPLQTWG